MTSPRYAALAALVTLGVAASGFSASAQSQCGPRQDLVKNLGDKFKESPIGRGLTQPGQVLEIFASQSGSWTMVVTTPNGTSCLIAAGENWDMMAFAKGTPI
jgi:hypothetical protein